MTLNFFRGQLSALNMFFEVTVISSPHDQLLEISGKEGVRYKAIKIWRKISVFNDVKSLFKLYVFFRDEKPSVIHCNTPKASLLGLLAGRWAKIPNRIYYIHGLRYEGAYGLKRKLLIAMERLSCRFATDIIAVSSGVQEIVKRDLTDKTVNLIRYGSANGINIHHFLNTECDTSEVKVKLGISLTDFVFGFVGRLVGDKGINELVSAFAKINEHYPRTKLLLVGFYEEHLDPLLPETLELIQSNSSIIEAGFQKDVKKYLAVMDVFVSPSYREGFGQSLLEANLMGKPVIASAITGYNEIVKDGINGFLIPPFDQVALYKKMESVHKNSEQLLLMAHDCRQNVLQRYNHIDVLKDSINYYRTFLDK